MRTTKDIEEICRKLKPIIGDKAERLWLIYLAEDDKGRRELALDIEIMAEKLLKKGTLQGQSILLEPPSVDDASGEFPIGDIIYNEKKLHHLFLRPGDFIKQVGIFAVTGEGKTNLAFLLALQLLKAGIPFMVIDWKRSWRNLLSLQDEYPELKKMQVYTVGRDIAPFLWNPFRQPPHADRELWISTIAEVLERSHISGPGVAYYFNRIYSKLLRGFKGQGFYPNFADGLAELEATKAYARELRWKQTALRIFNSFTLGPASKVFNERDPIKLENLFNKPVILELDLEMPKPLRTFFTEMILRWIHLYRLSQGETDTLRHVLFLEEVHNLFSKTRIEREASSSLENIYREIRAFGQGLISITQHPSMLPLYLLGNCHTQIYLGLQHEDDIRTERKSLFLGLREEAYPNMLRVGEAIVKIKNRVEPCLVRIPLVPVKKGGITDRDLKKREIDLPVHWQSRGYLAGLHNDKTKSNRGYLAPDKYNKEKIAKYPNTPSTRLLIDIHQFPLSNTTQRYKRLGMNPERGNNYKNILISQGCIEPVRIITKSGHITLFKLTPRGKTILKDLGHEVKDTREGIIHRFWRHKIEAYFRNKGHEVLVEEHMNGEADLIVLNGNKKMAVEIETGLSNFIYNIEKNLKAGFDSVVSVATNRSVEEKIKNELAKKGLDDERIKVVSVTGFDI